MFTCNQSMNEEVEKKNGSWYHSQVFQLIKEIVFWDCSYINRIGASSLRLIGNDY